MENKNSERTYLFREIIHDLDQPLKIRDIPKGMDFAEVPEHESLAGERIDDFYRAENEELPLHYSFRVYYYEEDGVVVGLEVYLEQDITAHPEQSLFDETADQLTDFYTKHYDLPEKIVETDPDFGEYFECSWNVPEAEPDLVVTVMTYFADQVESMTKVLKVVISV